MGEIIVKRIAAEVNKEKHWVEKAYNIDGKEVIGHVDRLSLNPLRFLEYELAKRNIKVQKIVNGDNPWSIEELKIRSNNPELVEKELREIMEYRCHPEHYLDWNNIIRQLPFAVLMETSDAIMNFGKKEEDIEIDRLKSDRRWREISREVRYIMGESYAQKYAYGNPNGTIDELKIPKDEPEKRKHLIYDSMHGGYSIKTQTYEDSSLDHYCFYDSKKWD